MNLNTQTSWRYCHHLLKVLNNMNALPQDDLVRCMKISKYISNHRLLLVHKEARHVSESPIADYSIDVQ